MCPFLSLNMIYNGFNRYMVECEWGYIAISKSYIKVLIDTWWNVNVDVRSKFGRSGMF